MNTFNSLEQQLDQLGRELSGTSSFADDVMTIISGSAISTGATPAINMITDAATQTAAETCDNAATTTAGTAASARQRWRPEFTVLATAASLLIVVTAWLLQPPSLYAQVLAALDNVRTIHMTGWTSELVRKWPLEGQTVDSPRTKYPVDAWYWKNNGLDHSHETFGPVVQMRRGGELKEYQSDSDLLFIAKGRANQHVERLSSLANYLKALQQEGSAVNELGTRTEDGLRVRGLELKRNGRREEFWFDTNTNLPIKYIRSTGGTQNSVVDIEVAFAYDQKVPAEVTSYTPPDTQNVRYGGHHDDVQIAWKQHVQQLGQRRQQQDSADTISVIPRDDQQTFSLQYNTVTPDRKSRIIPLDHDQYQRLTVKNFINLRVAGNHGDRAYESWRVADDLLDLEFPRSDLVCDKDTAWRKWVTAALNELQLEFVDVTEERVFWIAEHDGRQLKPYTDVNPPVPYVVEGGRVRKGYVKPGIGHTLRPVTLAQLLEDFNRVQNLDFKAIHPIVIDQTKLPRAPRFDRAEYATWDQYTKAVNYEQYLVATDSPWFRGEESQTMARDWYAKEFGVTFREETRPATVHVVRRQRVDQ